MNIASIGMHMYEYPHAHNPHIRLLRFAPAWIGFGHAFAAQDESDQATPMYTHASIGAGYTPRFIRGGVRVGHTCTRVGYTMYIIRKARLYH